VKNVKRFRRRNTPRPTTRTTGEIIGGPPTLQLLSDWLTIDQYLRECPEAATRGAIHWDVSQRERNGLAAKDAVRVVRGKTRLHRYRYTAYRLGEPC